MKQNKMMQQVMDMQRKMEKVQRELDEKTVEASSGGDMVTVIMTGNQEVKEIKINPEVVNPDDIEMLQDLIIAAINEAYAQASELSRNEMGKVTGGLNIPGFDLGQLGL